MGRRADLARSRNAAAKVAAVIILCAIVGVWLLSVRQRRLAAAHELAVAHSIAQEHERTILRLKQEIARGVSLPGVRAAAAQVGVNQPVLAAPAVEPAHTVVAGPNDGGDD